MRDKRSSKRAIVREVPIKGRRNRKSAANSLQFFARIEGQPDHDGRIRSANGMRWRLA